MKEPREAVREVVAKRPSEEMPLAPTESDSEGDPEGPASDAIDFRTGFTTYLVMKSHHLDAFRCISIVIPCLLHLEALL